MRVSHLGDSLGVLTQSPEKARNKRRIVVLLYAARLALVLHLGKWLTQEDRAKIR